MLGVANKVSVRVVLIAPLALKHKLFPRAPTPTVVLFVVVASSNEIPPPVVDDFILIGH